MPTISQRLKAAYQGFRTGMLTNTSTGFQQAYQSSEQRLARYAERWQWYSGVLTRSDNNILARTQWRRLKYNFCRPICGMAAGWMVGPTVKWKVIGKSEAQTNELSKVAQDIWDRSEGDSEMLMAELTGAIYGDKVLSVRTRDGRIMLEWVDPCICEPIFDPGDVSKLLQISICYGEGKDEYEEVWTPGKVTVTKGEADASLPLNFRSMEEIPFAWIPNMAIKGQAFGDSELDAVMPLIEEYDHIATKETKIIDYYSAPALKARGITKGSLEIEKDIRTIFYIPKETADLEYLEWKGSRPDVREHLDRTRNGIAEVSETPNIAFGQIDSGFSGASGVSLKVLFGPANGKRDRKRALSGPRIERMMHLAMRAEGYEVDREQVEIVWQDATPQSELEFMQVLQGKKSLGATPQVVLQEAGYSPEQASQMVNDNRAEADAKAARDAQMFSRGAVIP